jgi:hypothetical protein
MYEMQRAFVFCLCVNGLAIFFCNFTFSYVYASCDTTTYPHQTLTDIRIIFDVPNLSYLLKYREGNLDIIFGSQF